MLIAQQNTAISAYQYHVESGTSRRQQLTILSFIERRGGTWSIGELSRSLGIEKSTVSARLNELVKTGELEPRPRRKDRMSGITIRPVALHPKQLALI